MTDPTRPQRLDEAVARFLTAEERGTPLTAEEWLAGEPDLRPELERFLADRRRVKAVFAEATAEPDDAGFEPGAEFDGLRIVRLLRAGGMGRVYEAVQSGLDRPVAVKAVPAGKLGGAFGELFRAEVRAVGRLEHPHVVPVYGCGERAGRPYLVMGLMAGSLREELTAGPLPAKRAAEVVRAVALGVQYAHDHGFLHRDIKPSNVLFDGHGVPRLGDFGLVVKVGAGGGRAGTAGYMAPEQWGGVDGVSERSDVYGLGAVLYECLTGKPPGDPTAAGGTPPVPASSVNPQVDKRLEAVCRKCLSRDPADRFPSAAAVARELDRYLRPSRRLVMTGAMLAVVLLAVGVVAWRGQTPVQQPGEDADAVARSVEYSGLMDEVRGRAQTRPMGWTWENREALERAAAIDTTRTDAVALRTEWARTFAHPDLRETGTFAAGPRYEAAAFRPGTKGNQIALGPLWRGSEADPAARPRVDLFDRTAGRVVRSWHLPFSVWWEVRRRPKEDGISAVAFTPDGKWLIVGTRSGGIYALDPDAGAEPRFLKQEWETVKHLFPTADGTAVLTLSLGGQLRRWRVSDWRQEAEAAVPSPYPEGWELTAAVSPLTGDLFVSAPQGATDAGGTLLVRFTPTLVEMNRCKRPRLVRLPAPHPHTPVLMVSADGERPTTPPDLVAGGPLPPGFDAAHDRHPERAGFTPDGRLYYTGDDSPLVKFWDAAGFAPAGQVKYAGACSGCVAVAPDAPLLAVVALDGVHLFERSAGGSEGRVGFHARPVEAVGLSADGGTVLTASDGGISTWKAAGGMWRGTRWDLPLSLSFTSPRVLPAVGPAGFGLPVRDGVWTAFEDRPSQRLRHAIGDTHRQVDPFGRVWVWRQDELTVGRGGADDRPGWRHPSPGRGVRPVTGLAVDGDRAVLPLIDGRAVRFDLGGGSLKTGDEWWWDGPMWTATALLPDGGPLVAGDAAGRVRVLDPKDGRELGRSAAHAKGVTAVVPLSGGWVLSGGQDGRLALCSWDGQRLAVEAVVPFDRPVLAVAVAADGVTVAVLCEGERQARVWRLDELNAAWTQLGVGLDLPPPVRVPPTPPRESPPADATGLGLWLEVYQDACWGQRIAAEVGPTLSNHWGDAAVPNPRKPKEFSIEWRGYLTPPSAGRYRFRVAADDHIALYLNDRQVAVAGTTPAVCDVELPAGPVPIRVEYAEFGGSAWFEVKWSKPGPDGFDWRYVDASHLTPHRPK